MFGFSGKLCIFALLLIWLTDFQKVMIKLYQENPNPKQIQQIVDVLKDGGLIIYPTDTIYAIGCDIFNAKAVEKVCQMKGVSSAKANLSFVCKDLSHIAEYAKVSTPVFKLMKRYLPGPYTFILNGSHQLPKLFKQKKTVGIRIPDNAIALAIVEALGNPLLSMTLKDDYDEVEYTCDPELIEERYGRQVVMVIDGGMGQIEASTLIDCTVDEPIVVRQGLGEVDF
ncbi:MAG: threonylcarbamoyl-AMP synthase [Bacteroidales bacterium]|nr:threonylcarbamoyl-AMP synthase [Bacteroidales bacterium]